MRARLALGVLLLVSATSVFGKEVWIAASGTANGIFFSDARVFNPNDQQITIQAYYFPRDNQDRSGEQPKSFTVEPRQMRVFDDIVATLLQRTDVGAIRFVSASDFVVTQRVYLSSTTACAPGGANPCTLGQFVNGVDVTNALKKGVILQLKGLPNTKFRTNIGAANTTTTAAAVTWRLYDKNNAIIATKNETIPPYGSFGPREFSGYLGAPAGSDLSDAWVSFTSDQPLIAYGSVVDNSSGDQTYIAASNDSGTTPDTPQIKTVVIQAQDFFFTVTKPAQIKAGDQVKFVISQTEGAHGFSLADPNGNPLINLGSLSPVPIERTITLTVPGNYVFFCTNTSCGEGHTSMTGEVTVGTSTDTPGGPGRY